MSYNLCQYEMIIAFPAVPRASGGRRDASRSKNAAATADPSRLRQISETGRKPPSWELLMDSYLPFPFNVLLLRDHRAIRNKEEK